MQQKTYKPKSITEAADSTERALHYAKTEQFIRSEIKPVKPKYAYPGENNIHPAFENIEQVAYPLQPLEKRIWVLRSDFLLVTGVKNANVLQLAKRGG